MVSQRFFKEALYRSRSFLSQSECRWPRCWTPAGWGKTPGCPELSDCGSELEYLVGPGCVNITTKAHWILNEICSMTWYDCGAGLTLRGESHTSLSPDSGSWLHSRCQHLKTPRSNRHLSSHRSCGRETALSLLGHEPQNTLKATRVLKMYVRNQIRLQNIIVVPRTAEKYGSTETFCQCTRFFKLYHSSLYCRSYYCLIVIDVTPN